MVRIYTQKGFNHSATKNQHQATTGDILRYAQGQASEYRGNQNQNLSTTETRRHGEKARADLLPQRNRAANPKT